MHRRNPSSSSSSSFSSVASSLKRKSPSAQLSNPTPPKLAKPAPAASSATATVSSSSSSSTAKRSFIPLSKTSTAKELSASKKQKQEEVQENGDDDEDDDDDDDEEMNEQNEATTEVDDSQSSAVITAASSAPSSSTSSTPSSSTSASLALAPFVASSTHSKNFHRKLVVVLIRAQLETIKTKKGYELASADSHSSILKRLRKNPADMRPDICHQALMTLLDSPLNKAGHLQVYVQTEQNILIEVSPHLRIPRTFKRFAGLMTQLLHRQKIRAADGPEVLLKLVKNPVTQYLPPGAKRFGTSVTGQLVEMNRFVCTEMSVDEPCVLVVGSHANGPALVDWTDRLLSVSQYPLSAAYALSRMLHAFELKWNIL